MRSVLILAIFVLSLISCSNDFPPAPEMKFCKLEKMCESVHIFSKDDCDKVGGEIVDTCEEMD
jgi:hypothetical protein